MYLGVWWNPFSWGQNILESIVSVIYGLLLSIDCIIYSFVSYIYQIFLVLAQGGSIIDDQFVRGLVNRIYIIIGVVMLFIIAYSLLKSMINLEDASKGKNSPINIVRDVVISVSLIALLPYVFDFAFQFQNSLLVNNTIGKIIVGTHGSGESTTKIRKGGFYMAEGVWQAFMHANEGYCNSKAEEEAGVDLAGNKCETITIDGDDGSTTFGTLWDEAEEATTFWALARVAPEILTGKVSYYILIAPIAGIFTLFVLLSYCLDMAIRLVKLSVYQIIAPIPLFARILPNDQAKKVFTNWVKATLSTFTEVFIRIAILYFAVLVITSVTGSIKEIFTPFLSGTASMDVLLLAQALVIVGIIMFVKQAPEIIKEITGLDGSKYNVLKSAKQGLSLVAGGIAGGSPAAAVRAWDQAGQAKNLLDFSAVGNQYKRRQAIQEAKDKGASRSDRMGDALRKRFGFETKLEMANRNLDRGLDVSGNVQTVKNDTDGAIYGRYVRDEHGNFVMEEVKDEHGNTVYELEADGSFKLDANGNKIAKMQRKKEVLYAKDSDIVMTDEVMNTLQNEKDNMAMYQSEVDEQIRHVKEGQALDQKYIDLRGKIKKKAMEKITEGHNHVKRDLIVDGVNLGNMNYAAMLAYKQSRISDGASAEEIQKLETAIKTAEDEMWVAYSDWAIEHDKGGEISTWYEQAMKEHDEVGLYDAKTGKLFKYDKADLSAKMAVLNADGIKKRMEFFEGKDIKLVQTDGVTAYTDASGTQRTGRGLDKISKANANDADTIIQGMEISKVEFEDNVKRIDRAQKQIEERKTSAKSSPTYQRYKASDEANKINDSGKN